MLDPQDLDSKSNERLEFAAPGDSLADWMTGACAMLEGALPSPTTGPRPGANSAPIAPRRRAFQVRLMRFDRPQSRTLSVYADSEATARSEAIRQMGREWRIVSISAV